MNVLDVLILVVLVSGLWQGFNHGLLKSVVSMLGWLLALLVASYLAKPLAPFFTSFTSSPVLNMMAAFLCVALFVIVGLQLVLWVMNKTLQGLRLTLLDKIGGAIFGCGKNVLVMLLLLSVLVPLMGSRERWQQSKIIPALLPFAPFAKQVSKKLATTMGTTAASGMAQLGK